MAKVECTVKYQEVENDNGQMIDGVVVECGRCEHTVESCGTSSRSVRRCLALLREECAMGEDNYYVTEDPEDMEDG